ncbi:hypothetical protein [Aquamicrobium sp. LC103]|uniref:hypothetical protein n=1 Tax=Aquamicrobium sp. LC103 TaxID=1120658 RepID=UPI00063E77EF|nr:hypothetical protein [Aquamicrobium sp. LC103]TKT80336.1 hypothetical protein XW59_008325 [Aquamicrobium sp. LC103]
MYESSDQPPLPLPAFLRRVALHFGVVLLLVLGSLAIGVSGYVYFEGLSFPDAFLHSATLLGGLGLVAAPASTGAKLFAGFYALYSGLVFLAAFGVILAPVLHRVLHLFHWNDRRED